MGNPIEQAKPLQPPKEKKSTLDLKMEQLADMHINMMKSHVKLENETRTSKQSNISTPKFGGSNGSNGFVIKREATQKST